MFTTAQFRVFAGEPEERALTRPRHLLRDGKRGEAEAAYREVLANEPRLKAAWGEYFQLLRAEGRFDEALALADRAIQFFEGDAFSGALKGAALVEMGRLREALKYLQASAELDPDFGMVWHEMGYAAYRLGEYSHALLTLDRAFSLDPRSGTLHLRGKILRTSGKYLAAEVAFAGAAEAAEFPEQRVEAENQIATTRRYAHLGKRPTELAITERVFAEHGTVVLCDGAGAPATDADIVEAFGALAIREKWQFTVMVPCDSWDGWERLGQALNVPITRNLHPAFGMVPLIAARRAEGTNSRWSTGQQAVRGTQSGLTLVLEQEEHVASADIVGRILGTTGPVNLTAARQVLHHPEGRLSGRRFQ
jgi:Flp pilus assembly protein TadD